MIRVTVINKNGKAADVTFELFYLLLNTIINPYMHKKNLKFFYMNFYMQNLALMPLKEFTNQRKHDITIFHKFHISHI